MKRVLTFDGEIGKTYFAFCYQALVCAPYLKANAERNFDTKRRERTLHKAFKTISEPVPDDAPEPKYQPFGVPARRLIVHDGPAMLVIGQGEHDLLKTWVEQFPWGGGQPVEDGVETAEWLATADTQKE
jgi:hypothetical protein